MAKTFKELNQDSNIDKEVKKVGLSLGIVFSKEDQSRFNIKYGSVIRLNNAEIGISNDSEETEEITQNPKDI